MFTPGKFRIGISVAILLLSGLPIFSQNISINTSGAANSTMSMLEILQISATATSKGLYVTNSGGNANNYAAVFEQGNVGIGTTGPSNLLHISGNNDNNSNYYSQFRVDGTGAYPLNIAGISLNPNAAGVQSHIRFMENGTPKVQIRFNNGNTSDNKLKIYSWTTGSDFVTFDAATGNVGIGTTGPSQLLHITSATTTGSAIRIANTDAGGQSFRLLATGSGNTGGAGAFTIFDETNSAFRFYIGNTGNVGIGITSPQTKLDVRGIVAVNGGTLYAATNNYLTTGALNIGDYGRNYGGGSGWNANTAGLFLECLDNTEIAVHDASTRIASMMYFEGAATNRITIGRDMGWGTIGTLRVAPLVSGASGAIVRTNSSGDLAITNFTGNATDILLGNNTFGTIANAGGVTSACATANYVPKMTSATAMSCSQINDNGTNVGIGVVPGAYKLDVVGDINSSTYLRAGGYGMNAIPTAYGTFGLASAKNGYYGILFGQATSNPNVMYDAAGNGGIYYENWGWQQYYLVGTRHLNINTSTDLGATLGVPGNGAGRSVLMGDPGCGAGYAGLSVQGVLSGCTNYTLLGDGSNLFVNRPTGGAMYFRYNNADQMNLSTAGALTINNLAGSSDRMVLSNAGGTLINLAAGTSGQVLTSNGAGVAPSWAAGGGGTGWLITGNAGTVDGTNFIGTTDNIPFNFRLNNQKSGRIDHLLFNVFLGYLCGEQNTNGAAPVYGTTGFKNTAIGKEALRNNKLGINNTAVGYLAMLGTSGPPWPTGENNTVVGSGAYSTYTTGNDNSIFGFQAMSNCTTGTANTAIGYEAMVACRNGNYNTAVGKWALYSSYTGSRGTAVGYYSQQWANNTTTAYDNTCVSLGYEALKGSNCCYSLGNNNTSLGYQTLKENFNGDNNLAVGHQAGYTNNNGDNNTSIGYQAGYTNSNGNSNVFLGYQAGYNETGSNKLYISNSSTTTPLIGGDFSTGWVGHGTASPQAMLTLQGAVPGAGARPTSGIYFTTPNNANVRGQIGLVQNTSEGNHYLLIQTVEDAVAWRPVVLCRDGGNVGIGRISTGNKLEVEGTASNTAATAWAANSDCRIKTDIRDIDDAIATIMKLRPVKFKYTEEWKRRHPVLAVDDRYFYNFVAQEYRQVFPESVKGSGEFLESDTAHKDEILQVDPYYSQIVAIKAIQEQQKIIEGLLSSQAAQQKLIEKLLAENKSNKLDYQERMKKLEEMMGIKAEK